MRVIFAFVMIVLAGLSLAQPMSQKDFFQVTAAEGSYTTGVVYGGGGRTTQGYRFTVTARSDGALPVVTQFLQWKLNHGYVDGEHVSAPLGILRKVGTAEPAAYAWVAQMPRAPLSSLTGNGLMLSPGEYLIQCLVPPEDPEELVGAALLSGHYLNPERQLDHWQLAAGRFDHVQTNASRIQDRVVMGWRFTVQAHPEGALPVVTQMLSHSWPEAELQLWKRGASGSFFRYAAWSFGEDQAYGNLIAQPATPGLLLGEGEYLMRFHNPHYARGVLGHLVLLSGFWSPRD